MTATVVAAVHRLPMPVFDLVTDVCERMQRRLVPWIGDGAPRIVGPTIVVAGLPSGDRRIAPDLADLLDDPTWSLLLLTEDPLIQASVSMWSGKVQLLGPPFHDRLEVQLRAMTEGARASIAPAATTSDEGPGWWAGWVGEPRPVLHTGAGLTALVTRTETITPERLAAAAAELGAGRDAGLAQVLGDKIGAMRLERESRHWSFTWPSPEWPLWLFSAQRLPPWWSLSATLRDEGTRTLRLPAFPGDVAIGLVPAAGGIAPATDIELAAAVASGARATLEVLARRTAAGEPSLAAAVVIEVRP